MAYPGGNQNHDDRVVKLVSECTGVSYARTILSTHSFDMPTDVFRWNPTVYHRDWDRFEQFCEMIAGREDIFYGTNKEILEMYKEEQQIAL